MQNWKSRMVQKGNEKFKFDCEKYLSISAQERQNLSQLKRFMRFQWFIEASKLKKGQVFGDRAFDQEDIDVYRRRATYKTATKCEFAVLSRKDYMRVLRKIESKQINNKANFLMQIPLFNNQSFNQIKKLTNLFNYEHISRTQFLFQQGDLP